jgi:RNA ligase
MSWNPILNKFIEIKYEYIRRFGSIVYDYKDGYTNESKTCLNRWVSELNKIEQCDKYKEYEDFISCLELNQHENMLLFRYGRYSNIYDGETEVSGEDFWDRYDGIYRECRSVVIDVVKDCIILCPMKKFWNLNELEETSLENIQDRISKAKTIEFSDKLDGSMQSARWYDGKIVMAGSQAVNPNKSWRLKDGYRMIHSLPGYKEILMKYSDYTFIFEYIALKDTHVVKYTREQEGLYLISIRDIETGYEWSYNTVISIANEYNIPTTKLFNKTLKQVLSELDDKSSDEAEGFVINIDGYRVKVKYSDYVSIHKALSKLSSVNLIIRSIADDKYDDLLSKLPIAYHDNVKKVAGIVVDYINKTEKTIREYYSRDQRITGKSL